MAGSASGSGKQWKTSSTPTSGTESYTDGRANTRAAHSNSPAVHPVATYCYQTLGNLWYVPAWHEMINMKDKAQGTHGVGCATAGCGIPWLDNTTGRGRLWGSTQSLGGIAGVNGMNCTSGCTTNNQIAWHSGSGGEWYSYSKMDASLDVRCVWRP